MLRVAYIDHTAKWSGGEVALFNILTHIGEQIDPLVILAEDGALAERLRENGMDVRIIPLDESIRSRGEMLSTWEHLLQPSSCWLMAASLRRS